MPSAFQVQTIQRFSLEKGLYTHEDSMVVEEAFTLLISGQYHRTLYCCPSWIEELVIGNLASEGIIGNASEIKSLHMVGQVIEVELQRPKINTSRAAIDKIETPLCHPEDIIGLMKQHLDSSDLHKLTGGVHLMSLVKEGQLLITREDVGRHNAIDKLFGHCLINQIDCTDKILLSSGRITHEIIRKVMAMGIKVVVSRAAVTSLAASIALDEGITILGFTRGYRFNVYTHPERILFI